MTPLKILALAARFAPGFLQIRRGTWIAMGLGLLAVFALLIWAAVTFIGWLLGQGSALVAGAPEVAGAAAGAAGAVVAQVEQVVPGAAGAAGAVAAQVEQIVPGARERLGELVPALKPEPPQRDVSGTDIGPVARYPNLARTHWRRDGDEITVRYAGRADYAAVLDHYVKGFAAQGYAKSVLSAAPEGEEHAYGKGDARVRLKIAQHPQGMVEVTVIARQP